MAMMQTLKVQAGPNGQTNGQVQKGSAQPRWSRLLGLTAIVLILGMLFFLPFWQQVASAHEAPGGLAAGILEGVHLTVQDGAPLLHPPVVATANDLTLVDDDRADRDAALGQAQPGFVNRGLHEGIHLATSFGIVCLRA